MLLSLLLAATAFASPHTYDIDMQLSAAGRVLSAPRLTVTEGSTTKIDERGEDGETFLEVLAQEERPSKGILMQVAVGSVDYAGKRTVLARPQFIALENVASELKLKPMGHDPLVLKITARKSQF